MENVSIVGVDLSKEVFQICMMNHAGRVLGQRKVSRSKLLKTMGQFPSGCKVYMEACQGSHYWSREFRAQGLNVQQIAPQFVKPFVKSQKNDFNDAEAICEAGSRANMRFVPQKSVGQLELQAMLRIRERLMHNRTAIINQMRGVLAEHGVVFNKGRAVLNKILTGEYTPNISPTIKELVSDLYSELLELEKKIKEYDGRLLARAKQCSVVQRLCTIPGIGTLTALALCNVSGNPKEFKNGRQFSALLGLVPRQVSTAGKTKLLGISKRGDVYTRTLLIHGARAVVRHCAKKTDPYSLWIQKLHAKHGTNHTAVAVANKNARVAWRILTSNEEFDAAKLAKAEIIQ